MFLSTSLVITALALVEIPSLEEAPLPNAQNLASWRDHIRPTEDEVRWEQFNWLTSYHEGLRQARELNKPMLFWAMNGHPLGCT